MIVIIANAIDFIAALLQVGSGSIKKKSNILLVQIIQLFIQGVSMLLLGGVTGAINNVFSCVRNYLCYKEKLNRVWKGILIAASVAMTVFFNTQGWLGIIPVTVLQTVAANLGSMATPVGNPQNLYLYAAYSLSAGEFFSVVLPLTAVSLAALTVASVPVLPKILPQQSLEEKRIAGPGRMAVYGALFVLCLLTVFRVVPYQLTTAIVVAALFVVDRKLLKEIDFMLLLTFVCFFVVSENLGRVEAVRDFLQSLLSGSTLLTAVGGSQVISNVPAAVLLSGFTDSWRELLAGVNIGGLGTPIASLASLITLKLYKRWPGAKIGKFLAVFTVANIAGLALLLGFSLLF